MNKQLNAVCVDALMVDIAARHIRMCIAAYLALARG